jgi:hypothetical protein
MYNVQRTNRKHSDRSDGSPALPLKMWSMAIAVTRGNPSIRRRAIVDQTMRPKAAAKLDAWKVEQKVMTEAKRKAHINTFQKPAAPTFVILLRHFFVTI